MSTASKTGEKILVKDIDGDVYLVAWLANSYGYRKKKEMCWVVPESWQDEQGGYFTIDNPVGWQECPK